MINFTNQNNNYVNTTQSYIIGALKNVYPQHKDLLTQ